MAVRLFLETSREKRKEGAWRSGLPVGLPVLQGDGLRFGFIISVRDIQGVADQETRVERKTKDGGKDYRAVAGVRR